MQGTIKKLASDRGFGFIAASEGGPDVFFHCSAVEEGAFDSLHEGQSVEYDLEAAGDRVKGPRAGRVRPS